MLSSFLGFINAVQACYNYCPSYTIRITPGNSPFQKTERLAAHLMPHEMHTGCCGWREVRRPLLWKRTYGNFPCGRARIARFLVVWSAGISRLRIPGINFNCCRSSDHCGSLQHVSHPADQELKTAADPFSVRGAESLATYGCSSSRFYARVIKHGLLGDQSQVAVRAHRLCPHSADRYRFLSGEDSQIS